MSERFSAQGDSKNEYDTSPCCVSLILKEYLDVEAREMGLQGKKEAPGLVYNESDEKSIYLV